MFDPTSRYNALETRTMLLKDGRMAAYKRRRFLPKAKDLAVMAELQPAPGDRLDLFASRTLGDPLAFWRICDANDAMDPNELIDGSGRAIRVPVPQP
jgi:hypothetical protein